MTFRACVVRQTTDELPPGDVPIQVAYAFFFKLQLVMFFEGIRSERLLMRLVSVASTFFRNTGS
jgi:hypothetical protein